MNFYTIERAYICVPRFHAKTRRVINGAPWPGSKYGSSRTGDLSTAIEIYASEKHHAVCTSIEKCTHSGGMENTRLLRAPAGS